MSECLKCVEARLTHVSRHLVIGPKAWHLREFICKNHHGNCLTSHDCNVCVQNAKLLNSDYQTTSKQDMCMSESGGN